MLKPQETNRFVEPGTAFMELAGLDGQPTTARANGAAEGARAKTSATAREHFDVIVIGGGQAGLSVGYHLKKQGVRFVILDASERIGDAWRKRWDSLRLFSPAWLDSLDGMPFPAPRDHFPTKDEMADYLEAYAARFALPVRSATKVQKLCRSEDGKRFVVRAGGIELQADQVVIAMATFQSQRVPDFARGVRSDVVQLHSSEYKNPAQLREGAVLIVGGGNSGAEIAHEVSRTHKIFMTAPDVGQVPVRMNSLFGRLVFARLLMRVIFHRVLTIHTPIGRKARPQMMVKATPLIRVRTADLARDGVERSTSRVCAISDGLPQLDDGRVLDVRNIVWCTGYKPSQSWIDLPIYDDDGRPAHEAGVVTREPGLYFVGLPFLYSMSSAMVHGVGRDAERIAKVIAKARPIVATSRATSPLAPHAEARSQSR